jgi:hypothetical protein
MRARSVHKTGYGHNPTGRRRNRSWPEAVKREIVAASCAPGSSVSIVASDLRPTPESQSRGARGHLAPSYIADAICASGPRFGIEPDGISSGLEERM